MSSLSDAITKRLLLRDSHSQGLLLDAIAQTITGQAFEWYGADMEPYLMGQAIQPSEVSNRRAQIEKHLRLMTSSQSSVEEFEVVLDCLADLADRESFASIIVGLHD